MTRNQFKEILDRVLNWPADDQGRSVRPRGGTAARADDDVSEGSEIIVARARRDLASDKEIEQMFARYRSA